MRRALPTTDKSQWADSSDAWLHGFFHHGYADDLIGIKSIDTTSKTITMSHAAYYSIKSGRPCNRAHGIHILAEIDQPGEFFIDRPKGLCYLIPPAGTAPRTSPVLAPVMSKPLIALSDCRNITFKGIIFEQTRGTGITVENGARNRFVGCVIRSTGKQGIEITGQDGPMKARQGSMQHAIIDCDIYNTGTGGISIAGGNRSKLRPAGNLVSNSHIHHNNTVDKTYCPAVSLSGVGNIVRNCELHGNRNWVKGNAAKHIRPENKLADWHHTKNADREISSYARNLSALKIPSLHKIGLQPSPWRNDKNAHLAIP